MRNVTAAMKAQMGMEKSGNAAYLSSGCVVFWCTLHFIEKEEVTWHFVRIAAHSSAKEQSFAPAAAHRCRQWKHPRRYSRRRFPLWRQHRPLSRFRLPLPAAVMEKEPVPSSSPSSLSSPQPVYQQPAPQQPVYQQPAPQQPVYQQPAPQQPVYQQQAAGISAARTPAAGVSAAAAGVSAARTSAADSAAGVPAAGVPAAAPAEYQQTIPGNPLTEEQTKKGLAILAYFGILFLIPLFAAKKGSFARYHANQSLVLFIFMVVFNVLSTVLGNILVNISPLLTLVVTGVFSLLVLVLCVFALIGIIHAAKGQRKPVPIIGGITIIK